MRVARVAIHAPVTSFRHPFFVTGRQPTFDVPPPSTIHGHCASALGRWPSPDTFAFGVHFTYRARVADLEHQHITEALPPGTRVSVATPGGPVRATTVATVQPVLREMLFGVTMTLYLAPEVGAAFRAPVFPLVLGRSQDLAEVLSIDEVTLTRPGKARLEHTYLPFALRPCLPFGNPVLLSRHVGEPPLRETRFERYVSLHEPVFLGEGANASRTFIGVAGVSLDDLWLDPGVQDDEGFARGVWIHRIGGK